MSMNFTCVQKKQGIKELDKLEEEKQVQQS